MAAIAWAFTRNTNGWSVTKDSEEFSVLNSPVEMDTDVNILYVFLPVRTLRIDLGIDSIVVNGVAFAGTAKQLKDSIRDTVFPLSTGTTTTKYLGVKDEYGAKGDGKKVSDAVVTAASTNLTSPTAGFAASDVGKVIAIPYAGADNGTNAIGQTHVTTIAAFINSTTITLSAAPTKSIVGARTVSDAGINSGNTTLTSATANFTNQDIGKLIMIPGAGLLIGNSGGSPLFAWIVAFISATQVTISKASQATVSAQSVTIPGATILWGTDDLVPIQNAINDGAAQKKTVLIEEGRYLISAALVPLSNLQLIGFGYGKSILSPYGIAFSAIDGSSTPTQTNPITDAQFRNFEIDGIGVTANSYTTSNKGIFIRHMRRALFDALYIHDTSATGIGCDFLREYQIVNNVVEHCGRQVKEFAGSGGGSGIGIGTGINTEEEGVIGFNNVDDSGNHGIFVESQSSNVLSRGIRIIGNSCRWSGGDGIGDHATEGTVITGNICDYNSNGIGVSQGFVSTLYSTNGFILNNICRFNGTGIKVLFKNGGFTVKNNHVGGNSGVGGMQFDMAASGAPTFLIINGNTVHDHAKGIIFASGTFGTVEVENNHMYNLGISNATRRAGIPITASFAVLYLRGNKIYDNRVSGSKAMSYSVQMTSGTITKLQLENNDFNGGFDGDIDFTGGTVSGYVGRAVVADANYTAKYMDKVIAYSSITAARSVTLGAANLSPDKNMEIVDESRTATTTNKITIVGVVDGVTNPDAVTGAGGKYNYRLYSNGVVWLSKN
jgi:hypothetical protein